MTIDPNTDPNVPAGDPVDDVRTHPLAPALVAEFETRVLAALRDGDYQPLKPKPLARRMGVADDEYVHYRRSLRKLANRGLIQFGKNYTVRLAVHAKSKKAKAGKQAPPLLGRFRRLGHKHGIVTLAESPNHRVFIRGSHVGDAVPGDLVRVALIHKKNRGDKPDRKRRSRDGKRVRNPDELTGKVAEVVRRGQTKFVGTYLTADGEAFVRTDGDKLREDIFLGYAKHFPARKGEKVVVGIDKFPTRKEFGTGHLVEVLGSAEDPGIDRTAVLAELDIPVEFSRAVLEQAERLAGRFASQTADRGRIDRTADRVVTIDPEDAKDHDDAVALCRSPDGHWHLDVHIADVSAFVEPGTPLDDEARERGTSVYLPDFVVPMLPEAISNGIASLKEGVNRFAKTASIEIDADGTVMHTTLSNSVINVSRRLSYEQAAASLAGDHGDLPAEIVALLADMSELSGILRARRVERGILELELPEPKILTDADGRVTGAAFRPSLPTHKVVEEFMLTANEAVAAKLVDRNVPFLRRVHEAPDRQRIEQLGDFLGEVGFPMPDGADRFALQQVIEASRDTPARHAVHYAILRSMKEANYSPEPVGHYAVASDAYCHFTSPIRRYPDLHIHRLVESLIRTGKATADAERLAGLGEHCSDTARRAEKAERELVKLKILRHLADRVGKELEMIVTGVEEFGFFAAGATFPAEGLVHVKTLQDDRYHYDKSTHTLHGLRSDRRFRLGDRVRCRVVKVDLERRYLDLAYLDHLAKPSQ